jgi:hypothetical protein
MSLDICSFVKKFLEELRDFVNVEKMSLSRLPRWVRSAKVKIARINNSVIFLFEDSLDGKDAFVYCGCVKSDLQFLLGLPEYEPAAASFKAPDKLEGKLIILVGEYGKDKQVIFNVVSPNSALFNVGYTVYHSPLAIFNIFIQLSFEGILWAVRFVPFALYVHEKDLVNFEAFWEKCTPHIQDLLRVTHRSELGDYYESLDAPKSAVLAGKERSVIVFGKYTEPEINELFQIRDYLRTKGYDAYLLRDLPEHPSMSLEEKVKLWSLSSRFSVMVDREPSGHLVEFPYLKENRVILILLRPKDKPSTYMIGDESLVDINYIRIFEFRKSPLEVIDAAIKWAEELVKKRIKKYEKVYPWRNH